MRGAADSLSERRMTGPTRSSPRRPRSRSTPTTRRSTPTFPSIDARRRCARSTESDLAVGSITDEARIIDNDGDVVGTGPYFGAGVDPHGRGRAHPVQARRGRFADRSGEVVIDAGTAEKQDLRSATRSTSRRAGPAQEFEITGVATFGDVDSIGTATFALFDLDDRPGAVRQAAVATTRSSSAATASRQPSFVPGSPRR